MRNPRLEKIEERLKKRLESDNGVITFYEAEFDPAEWKEIKANAKNGWVDLEKLRTETLDKMYQINLKRK